MASLAIEAVLCSIVARAMLCIGSRKGKDMTDQLVIKTNNHTRFLEPLSEIPESARGEFDYITKDEQWDQRLFKYRGEWYDMQEFVRIVRWGEAGMFAHFTHNEDLLKWHGIQTDSAFTATVIRIGQDENGENVVVAGRLTA